MNSDRDRNPGQNRQPQNDSMTAFLPAPIPGGWGFLPGLHQAVADSRKRVRTQRPDTDDTPDIDRPKSMPRTARFVASSSVCTAPFLEWPMKWLLSTNRSRGHWILWYSWEDEHCKWQTCPVAWMTRKGLPAARAAFLLLEAYWRDVMRDQQDRVPGDDFDGGDLVSDEQLVELAVKVWTDQYAGRQGALTRTDLIRRMYAPRGGNPGSER